MLESEIRIRGMIEAGTISAEEGQRLIEALHAAGARDGVVADEFERVRKQARRSYRWAQAAIGCTLLAIVALIVVLVFSTRRSTPDVPSIAEIRQQLAAGDLDAEIERLETALRRPGSGETYRTLGVAYDMRFEQSENPDDRERAAQAHARADRIERRGTMRVQPGVFGIVLVLIILAFIGGWVMLLYNGLAKSDERVEERWAQVETQLQRRLDLIPQLVETVRGFAEHERETLSAVTEARARAAGALEATQGGAPQSAQAAQTITEAQAELSTALGRLLVVVEAYPDLKSSGNFLTLQDQLEGTENRIAVERQRYNDAVRNMNTKLRVFPSNVFGGMFGFAPHEYFESALGAEDPVDVEF